MGPEGKQPADAVRFGGETMTPPSRAVNTSDDLIATGGGSPAAARCYGPGMMIWSRVDRTSQRQPQQTLAGREKSAPAVASCIRRDRLDAESPGRYRTNDLSAGPIR